MKQFATVTVIGRDKTGVIARVTAFLFEQHANIEALEEQVTRGQFSMTLQASWRPADCNAASLRAGLDTLARRLGMEIKVRFTEPNRRQRFAIMVTKETHCFDALLAAHRRRQFKADPMLVISNRPDLAPLARKKNCRLRTFRGTTARRPRARRCDCSKNTRLISSCSRAS
jgi:formyltetrahydrofolate deformylase